MQTNMTNSVHDVELCILLGLNQVSWQVHKGDSTSMNDEPVLSFKRPMAARKCDAYIIARQTCQSSGEETSKILWRAGA